MKQVFINVQSKLKFCFTICSILLLSTACPEEHVNTPGEIPQEESTEVQEVTREENNQTSTFMFDRNSTKDKYTQIRDDLGYTLKCKYSGSKLTLIQLDANSSVQVSYNAINKVSEVVHDFGPLRLRGVNNYASNTLNNMQLYNEQKQPDSSFNKEIIAELTDINVNEAGGTLTFTTYVSGVPANVYDAELTCLSSINNLMNNIPFKVMLDFSDGFYNFTNQLEYCVSSIKLTNQSDNSIINLSYQYAFDSKNRITKKTQISSQVAMTDVVYGFKYFPD